MNQVTWWGWHSDNSLVLTSACLDSPDHSGRNSPSGWAGSPAHHPGASNNNNKVSSDPGASGDLSVVTKGPPGSDMSPSSLSHVTSQVISGRHERCQEPTDAAQRRFWRLQLNLWGQKWTLGFFKLTKIRFQGDKKAIEKDASENGGFLKTIIKIVTFGLSGIFTYCHILTHFWRHFLWWACPRWRGGPGLHGDPAGPGLGAPLPGHTAHLPDILCQGHTMHNSDLGDIPVYTNCQAQVQVQNHSRQCYNTTSLCQHKFIKPPALLRCRNPLTPHLFLCVLMRVSQIWVVVSLNTKLESRDHSVFFRLWRSMKELWSSDWAD